MGARIFYLIYFCFLILPGLGFSQKRKSISQNKVYALIVGIRKYSDPTLNTLQYADTDAMSFYNFLKNAYQPRPEMRNIKRLLNQEASISNVNDLIRTWLDTTKPKVNDGDVLFIYWSGHGMLARDDQQFLCWDSKNANPNNGNLISAISMSDLKQLARSYAIRPGVKVFLILDACRNNIVAEAYDQHIKEKATWNGGLPEFDLYATACDGLSFESGNLKPGSGVFTYFLLLGLMGGADRNPVDGHITIGELRTFLGNVTPYVAKYIPSHKPEPYNQVPEIVFEQGYNGIEVIQLKPDTVYKYRRIGDSLIQAINQLNVAPPTLAEGAAKGIVPGNGSWYRKSARKQASLANDTTPGVLSKESEIYHRFTEELGRRELVSSDGGSAYESYRNLLDTFPKSKLIITARSKLFTALMEKVKDLLDRYLDGTLQDVKKDTFHLAYDELKAALSLYPEDSALAKNSNPKLVFLKAREYAASKNPRDWKEGLALLDTGLARQTTASYLYHTKGLLYSNSGRYFTAKQYYDSAIKFAPDWINALYGSAVNNFKIQEYGQSIDTCIRISELDLNYSRAYSLRALNRESIEDYKQSGYYDEAIHWNMKALSVDSSNSAPYFNLGRIFSKILTNRNQNIEVAKYYYKVGVDRYSDEYCMTALGQVYSDMGPKFFDSASYYFEKALKINRFNAITLYDYAQLMDSEDQMQRGDSLFIDALNGSAEDYTIYSKYCSFVFRSQSPKSADSIFKKVVHLNHEDPQIFLEHSQQYEELDSLLKARDILRLGLSYLPGSPSLSYALAQLYFKHSNSALLGQNLLDSCQRYLDQVKYLNPEYSLVNYAKYQVSKLQKRDDSAQYFLTLAKTANEYVTYTKNFNKELQLLGDSALVDKRYRQAFFYYSRALELTEQNDKRLVFRIYLGIIRCYYLMGRLDSALAACKKANGIRHTYEEDRGLRELRGLIYFDKGDFISAFSIFQDLDVDEVTPDELEQSLCLFKLKNEEEARDHLSNGRENNPNAYKDILDGEGILYSTYFIQEMKQFVDNVPIKASRHHISFPFFKK